MSPRRQPEVLEAVHALMHAVRHRQQALLQQGGVAMTHVEAKVLGFFSRQPGATQRELALHSGRDKGQLARLVGGLRERGLLQGEEDPADRRAVRLRLTDEGAAALQATQRALRRLGTLAVAGLSADEQAQLLALLARVRDNVSAQPADPINRN
jgi:DNA-binding MarR family transcriptional regulator